MIDTEILKCFYQGELFSDSLTSSGMPERPLKRVFNPASLKKATLEEKRLFEESMMINPDIPDSQMVELRPEEDGYIKVSVNGVQEFLPGLKYISV